MVKFKFNKHLFREIINFQGTIMITVYTKPNCSNCEKTKRDMDILGIPYQSIDITVDTEQAKVLVALGYRSLPVVCAGADNVWQGYDQDKIKSLLSYSEENAHSIRCNMCCWSGQEDGLEKVQTTGGNSSEVINACPNCKTDEYLMDLP